MQMHPFLTSAKFTHSPFFSAPIFRKGRETLGRPIAPMEMSFHEKLSNSSRTHRRGIFRISVPRRPKLFFPSRGVGWRPSLLREFLFDWNCTNPCWKHAHIMYNENNEISSTFARIWNCKNNRYIFIWRNNNTKRDDNNSLT